MVLFLSAFSTSLDGFIIGFNWKLCKIKINLCKLLTYFGINFTMLILILPMSNFLPMFLFSNYIKALLFLFLGLSTLIKKKEDLSLSIDKKNEYLTIITQSFDSIIISLGFIANHSILFLSIIFSLFGTILIYCGYKFSFLIKIKEYNKYLSSILYLILAIISLF